MSLQNRYKEMPASFHDDVPSAPEYRRADEIEVIRVRIEIRQIDTHKVPTRKLYRSKDKIAILIEAGSLIQFDWGIGAHIPHGAAQPGYLSDVSPEVGRNPAESHVICSVPTAVALKLGQVS